MSVAPQHSGFTRQDSEREAAMRVHRRFEGGRELSLSNHPNLPDARIKPLPQISRPKKQTYLWRELVGIGERTVYGREGVQIPETLGHVLRRA
jgi:hypothetical protein